MLITTLTGRGICMGFVYSNFSCRAGATARRTTLRSGFAAGLSSSGGPAHCCSSSRITSFHDRDGRSVAHHLAALLADASAAAIRQDPAPTRVGLPYFGHTSITLVALIGASFSTMPPCGMTSRARVALDQVDLLDDDPALFREDLEHLPSLPRSLPEITSRVVLLQLHHSTSGASETIFMNFLSRSSRATGPKMRVPTGSCLSSA